MCRVRSTFIFLHAHLPCAASYHKLLVRMQKTQPFSAALFGITPMDRGRELLMRPKSAENVLSRDLSDSTDGTDCCLFQSILSQLTEER